MLNFFMYCECTFQKWQYNTKFYFIEITHEFIAESFDIDQLNQMFETKCLFCHEKDTKKSGEDDDLYLLLAE